MDLLLHSCCGPCASASVERLLEEGRKPLLFFSNSNILTKEEFERREASLARVAEHFHVPLVVDPWDNVSWMDSVEKERNSPEGGARCRLCFRFNLSRTAEAAKEKGLPFSSTLTISPHKSSSVIFEEGNRLGAFEEHNFKKKDGFRRSLNLSRELDLYRQEFCGCAFSLRD